MNKRHSARSKTQPDREREGREAGSGERRGQEGGRGAAQTPTHPHPHTTHTHARGWYPAPPPAAVPRAPMGSHMRSMDACEPPWLLNHCVKETSSRARTSRMPPSGSNSERTMGEVPRARELATLSVRLSCGKGGRQAGRGRGAGGRWGGGEVGWWVGWQVGWQARVRVEKVDGMGEVAAAACVGRGCCIRAHSLPAPHLRRGEEGAEAVEGGAYLGAPQEEAEIELAHVASLWKGGKKEESKNQKKQTIKERRRSQLVATGPGQLRPAPRRRLRRARAGPAGGAPHLVAEGVCVLLEQQVLQHAALGHEAEQIEVAACMLVGRGAESWRVSQCLVSRHLVAPTTTPRNASRPRRQLEPPCQVVPQRSPPRCCRLPPRAAASPLAARQRCPVRPSAFPPRRQPCQPRVKPRRTEEDVEAHFDIIAVAVAVGGDLATHKGAGLVDVHLVALQGRKAGKESAVLSCVDTQMPSTCSHPP